jgi:hypothetical protein
MHDKGRFDWAGTDSRGPERNWLEIVGNALSLDGIKDHTYIMYVNIVRRFRRRRLLALD